MSKSVKLQALSAVAAGSRALLSLPIGPSYDRLDIRMTGSEAADPIIDIPVAEWGDYIKTITLRADGETLWQVPASVLISLLQYRDTTLQAGSLPIFFQRISALTPEDEDATILGTVGLSSLSLEIELMPSINIGKLEVYAKQSMSRAFGAHYRIQRYTMQNVATGEIDWDSLPKNPYGLLALHFTTDAIAKLEITADGADKYESDAVIRASEAGYLDFVPQAGMTHVNLQGANRMVEMLNMDLQDFRVRMDRTATGQFDIYVESLHFA